MTKQIRKIIFSTHEKLKGKKKGSEDADSHSDTLPTPNLTCISYYCANSSKINTCHTSSLNNKILDQYWISSNQQILFSVSECAVL